MEPIEPDSKNYGEEISKWKSPSHNLSAQRPERAPLEDTADSEVEARAVEFFMNMGIDHKVSVVLVKNIAIPDLVSVMEKVPKIDTAEEPDIMEKETNPWAICTSQVGREDKEKYEKCVKSVKARHGGK